MRQGRRSSGYTTQARWRLIITLTVTAAILLAGIFFGIRFFVPPGEDEILLADIDDLSDRGGTQPHRTEPAESTPPASQSAATDAPSQPTEAETAAATEPETEETVKEATEPETEPPSETELETTAAATEAITEAVTEAPTDGPTEPTTADPNIPVVNEHGIYSKAALLLDLATGETLFSLGADEQVPPASLAKMMTAIVAIERCDLDDSLTVTEEMLKGIKESGLSTAGFKAGETVTVRDLLYGCMLPSGADAANALAFAAAGSVDAFVTLLNEKAAAIGMTASRFANTHGLTHANLYSTCTDLAKLLAYCLQNETFRQVFTTGTYVTTATAEHPDGITLRNSMTAAISENDLTHGHIAGNKTGFTTPAGQCLASLAVIDGREYILITVGAGKNGYNTQRYNLLDALYLYSLIA